jgi:dihydroorotate dehydrogenase electron transfer subunit
MKQTFMCEVLENKTLTNDVFTLVLKRPIEMEPILPSQFFNLKAHEHPYLRRPISISKFDEGTLEFTIIKKGEGTKRFQTLKPGEFMDVQGPLGNSYTLEESSKRVMVVGGGIGVPPQAVLTEALRAKFAEEVIIDVFLGFRENPYLVERFKGMATTLVVASEAGFGDYKGYVTDVVQRALENQGDKPYDHIYVCGPHILIEKVAKLGLAYKIQTQLLMEERMACGIGACMVCTCKVKDDTMPQGYWNKRVCKDGPVFLASEVLFDESC